MIDISIKMHSRNNASNLPVSHNIMEDAHAAKFVEERGWALYQKASRGKSKKLSTDESYPRPQ